MTCGGGTSATGTRSAAATVDSLYSIIAGSGSRSLADIGLVKNAGKTTVVNALMANCPHLFGLTSLGLDGERIDHLTGLAKPRIAPPAGTLGRPRKARSSARATPWRCWRSCRFSRPWGA